MERYAVLADIHGNVWALEAVLEDARRRGIERFINLGDSLYGPLEPRATAERLMGIPLVSVRGNEDRLILEGSGSRASSTVEYVRKLLDQRSVDWLAAQPETGAAGTELFLCHGTPRSDETYLLERASLRGGTLADPDSIRTAIEPVALPVVLCGHSHVPRVVHTDDARLIVNPGSVGLQAFEDETPEPHIMECGSPHARYAVAAKIHGRWSIEQVCLPYDWTTAADAARRNGRNDWAVWLERGRV